MDSLFDADTKGPRTPTLQEHRRRIQKLERQIQAEDSAAKHILDSDGKPLRSRKPLFKSLAKPRALCLESAVEQEKKQMHILINELNSMKFAVRAKEGQLMEVEEMLKAQDLRAPDDNSEHTYSQRKRQLENSLEKMRMKITDAEKIHSIYLHIYEHLQQEVQEMPMVLEQLQSAVAAGLTELDKVAIMSWSAVAAADSTTGKLAQMEHETMEEKRKMESQLGELTAVKKELEGRREKDGDHRSNRGQQKLKESMLKKEAEAAVAPVREQQSCVSSSASQSNIKLIDDMEALTESLGCPDLEELVKKLVSQQATEEELHLQRIQCEELAKQRTDTLADLELQFGRLKFSVAPGSVRLDKLKPQMGAELQQMESRIRQLEIELKRAEDMLGSTQQGVTNLYYRMACVPVKELPSKASVDTTDKLMDINTRFPMLLSRTSGQNYEENQDQEKVWSFLEQTNMMEPHNYKRPSSAVDTVQPPSDEEECFPSRDEIKRCSIKLTEAHQYKKKSHKGARRH